ncbi:Sporulation protein SpoOM [Methylacidimicrobium sp. AP8]|uniref:SpoIVB peptidase S55 domain-containing protein n=1 Tax=Methylacidimicrobium sp. AP8 TaxID=2730359 RepID=UPI0018C115A4|nr:SpoIVB peptidase S55 domain-containing protein [Methylacidimicrobium sp. AP8]CAB4244339.1 Sporulation protein SpoOM [Methylacidimicrobium sp. AP8]
MRHRLLFALLLPTFWTCLTADAQAAAPSESVFPKSQLRPGMHGLTYTVLQGNKIEPIHTEILGIAKDFVGPGLDLIIAKLVDAKTATTGAVHGMSGSPLYIDGKLVGALSRRIASFEKDGHCGFTPIEDMLRIEQEPSPEPIRPFPTELRDAWRWGGPAPLRSAALRADYLGIPLSVGGLNPKIVSRFLEALGFRGAPILAVPGGGTTAIAGGGSALEPGASLAAVMMTGDINISGTGTLTWRDGNRVLAFGHPMFGFGKSDLPMAAAEVVTTVPSYETPYKLTNVGPVVGTILEDRLSAIGGKVGQMPKLASYRFERFHCGRRLPTLRGEFVSHPLLTPLVVNLAMGQIFSATDSFGRSFTVSVDGFVHFRNLPSLRLRGLYSGEDGDLATAILEMVQPLQLLFQQPWVEPVVESLELKTVSTEKEENWTIERASVDNPRCPPGGTVWVRCVLQERHGRRLERRVALPLPPGLHEQSVAVRIASGRALDTRALQQKIPSAQSAEELIALLNAQHPNDTLYIQAVSEAPGIVSGASDLPALPPTIRTTLSPSTSSKQADSWNELIWSEEALTVPGVVGGEQTVRIEVR